jgi:hypothetical protein
LNMLTIPEISHSILHFLHRKILKKPAQRKKTTSPSSPDYGVGEPVAVRLSVSFIRLARLIVTLKVNTAVTDERGSELMIWKKGELCKLSLCVS